MRERSGQASVELLAILPVLVVSALVAAQALSAGWALWSAASAARAGARAEHVGSDGERAARRALPGGLRKEAEVSGPADGGPEIRVSVRAPALIDGLGGGRWAAATRLGAGDGR